METQCKNKNFGPDTRLQLLLEDDFTERDDSTGD